MTSVASEGFGFDQQDVRLVGHNGVEAGVTNYGYLRTSNEPNAWMTEAFDSLDTTNRWTLKNSTGTAAVAAGVLSIASSATALAYGGLFTQPTFVPNGLNFVPSAATMQIDTWTVSDTYRFIGGGTVPTTPTVANPITNGYGFEIDGSGNFNAVIWKSSVKTHSVSLAAYKPADGAPFYTATARRSDRIDFFVNNTLTPAATILIPSLDVSALPMTFMRIAGAAPGASATIKVFSFGVGDTGQNGQSIVDPTNPFLRATVKKASTAAAATDLPLVVALHPSTVPAIAGTAAHSAAASGNPVQVGGVVITAVSTGEAAGEVCRLPMTTSNQLVIKQFAPAEVDFQYTGILTTATAVAAKAAGAAGVRNYATHVSFQNTSATATTVLLLDGATTIAQWHAPANMALPAVIEFNTPRRGTAATPMNVNCGTAGANVLINVGGFQGV